MKIMEGYSLKAEGGKKHLTVVSGILKKIGAKINSLALFAFFIPVISLGLNSVQDGQAIFNVETKINVIYDGGDYSFKTNENILLDALKKENIPFEEKDAVVPARDTALNGGVVDVRITEALPYLLNDNGNKRIVFSGLTDAKEILKENEIKIYDEDKISLSLISDFYLDNSLGVKIIIERAPKIYLNIDGERRELRSWLKNIGEVIKEKNIPFGNKDKVEPDLNSYVVNGLEVSVTRVAESEIEEAEIVRFTEKIVEDINNFVGNDSIKQKGSNGLKKKTYKIISENGIMVSKSLLASETVEESTVQIRIKGSKPYNATTLWPTIVAATNKYGISASEMHKVMMCESKGNPKSVGYNVYGLFQYNIGTWEGASARAGYAGADWRDPGAQIYTTAWKRANDGNWKAWENCAKF